MNHEPVTAVHLRKCHVHAIEQESVGVGDIDSEPSFISPNQGSVLESRKVTPRDLAGDEVAVEERHELGEVEVGDGVVRWREEGEFAAGAGGRELEIEDGGDDGEVAGVEEVGGVGEGGFEGRGTRGWVWRGSRVLVLEVEVGVEESVCGKNGEVGVLENWGCVEGDIVD